jgi:secondary thiamine-phosphate synthase enzyme
MVFQQAFEIETRGRGTYEITRTIQDLVARAGITTGICQLFVLHTSASLIISENADPDVRRDLETIAARLAPDGDPAYRHDAEGPDDMSAHVRSVLTHSSLNLPVNEGRCQLGTWQGVFLWEHRQAGHRRRLTITVMGDQ